MALEKDALDGVKAAADELLSSGEKYREKINALKLEHLYSYGSNGAEGVKYILHRLSDKQKENNNK